MRGRHVRAVCRSFALTTGIISAGDHTLIRAHLSLTVRTAGNIKLLEEVERSRPARDDLSIVLDGKSL